MAVLYDPAYVYDKADVEVGSIKAGLFFDKKVQFLLSGIWYDDLIANPDR